MFFFRALLFALLIGSSSVCLSQSQVEAENLSIFLANKMSVLDRVHMNLLQMNVTQMDNQTTYVEPLISVVTDAVRDASDAISSVHLMSTIYSLMVHKIDRSTTKNFLEAKIKHLILVSERIVATLNKSLIKLKSPVVILEAQKARELILEMQAEIVIRIPIKASAEIAKPLQ